MKQMINIALPKGRLGEKAYSVFEAAGYECPSIKEENRKLIFENEEKGVRYFWVSPLTLLFTLREVRLISVLRAEI